MEYILENQLIEWLPKTFEVVQTKNFISTKDICILYNQENDDKIDLNNIKPFSISLSKCFNKLTWNVEKGKLNNVRGYFFIQLKNNILESPKIQHVQTCTEHVQTCTKHVQSDILSTLQQKIIDLELEITRLHNKEEHVQNPVQVVQDDPKFIWKSGFINTIIEKWLEKHVQFNSTSCTSVNLLISNFLSNNPSINLDKAELNKGGRFTTKIIDISKALWQTKDIKILPGNKREGSTAILGLQLK